MARLRFGDQSILVYDQAQTKFVATNVISNVTINGGSF